MSGAERKYLRWLYAAPGVGAKTALRLLETFGSAENVFRHAGRLTGFLTGERAGQAFASYCRKWPPARVEEEFEKRGVRFTALPLPDYPEKLRTIPDPPFGITWRGRLPDPARPAIAVIGARQCSAYGREMAKRFGAAFAAAGVQVVSGMAVGIDGLAQTAAAEAGGESFAILGGGADICYPPQNRALYERLIRTGGVISEQCPGTQPRAGLFPMRNRLISGFCDVLLVVEARRRSGTLITVDMALEQGRDIFVLPGRVGDALSDGCHQLIRQGAGIASSPEDVLEAVFGAGRSAPATDDQTGTRDVRRLLSAKERSVCDALERGPASVAEIVQVIADSGGSAELSAVMEALSGLCAKGIAVQEDGWFRRKSPASG